jgi:hypothetical protein
VRTADRPAACLRAPQQRCPLHTVDTASEPVPTITSEARDASHYVAREHVRLDDNLLVVVAGLDWTPRDEGRNEGQPDLPGDQPGRQNQSVILDRLLTLMHTVHGRYATVIFNRPVVAPLLSKLGLK